MTENAWMFSCSACKVVSSFTSLILFCLKAGGSSGTVFAWDLRWQQQPIILAGVGTSDLSALSPSESDVWEVHYDNYTTSSNYRNISESRVLPAMICSEDGILAVIEQGIVRSDFFCMLFRMYYFWWSETDLVLLHLHRWRTRWASCWTLCHQQLWHWSTKPISKWNLIWQLWCANVL